MGTALWTSDTMSLWDSFITFLIGFSIVFICLVALALFIIIFSKIIGLIVKEEAPKPVVNTVSTANASSPKPVVKEDNQAEAENLAVIIAAISEELREPVENFSIVSVTEI